MSPSIKLLKNRYLKNIKENPDLYVGIELEFPIVHTKGKPTGIEVSKDLLRFLVDALSLKVEKEDQDGNPIQLVEPMSQDRILFEVLIQPWNLPLVGLRISKRLKDVFRPI